MEIKLQQPNKPQTDGTAKRGGGVVIAANIQKESERLDRYGNVIDPVTKQIIKPVDQQ